MRRLTVNLLADAESATAAAARQIIDLIAEKPDAVLGLATGGTMEPLYAHLVRAHREGLSFAGIRTVNLDEYVGLSPEHPNSYHRYMAQHFFDLIDIPAAQIHLPRGDQDPEAAAKAYSGLVDQLGPVDLQLLGVGYNGHIAFNEPGTPIDAPTRVVTLSQKTRDANARFFTDSQDVPTKAITMGTTQIMRARRLVALAVWGAKAEILAKALDGPVSADCPASYLRTHPDCVIFTDQAAGAGLISLR